MGDGPGTIGTSITLTASGIKNASALPFDGNFNDGAWTIKGWTAQNQSYPDLNTNTPNAAVPTATITATFAAPDGMGAHGKVICTPSVRQFIYNGDFYELDPVRVHFDNGTVNFTLPAGSWTWDFRIRIGPTTMTCLAQTINSGTTVNLAILPWTVVNPNAGSL